MIRISQTMIYCAVCALLLGQANSAQAQAVASEPINVMHMGVDRLYEDLEYVFNLADEAKHYKTLKDTLDVFFIGMDMKTPAVIQTYVRKGKFNLVLHAPTANAAAFRNNVRALGLRSRQLAPGLFQVQGLFVGFMKQVAAAPNQTPVTIIAEDRADLKALGDHNAFTKKIDPNNIDFAASIVNGPKLLKDRESAVEEVRKQVSSGLKKLKEETDAQFELRKLTFDQQITQIKQLYAEAESIKAIADISSKNKQMMAETELVALPDTPLAAGIADLGKDPSYFANIPLNNTEPLSGFINFKLDAMRKEHLQAFLKQARPLIHTQIGASDSSTTAKNYATHSTDIIFDVLEQSATDGLLDGFINVSANESKLHTLIGATKGDGEVVKKGLTKLKESATVELDVAKVGEVSLHKVTLPNENMPEMVEIFGKELVLIVGTGPKAIWYALGDDAEAKLKAAMAEVEQPPKAKTNVLASVHAQALIWYQLFDAVRLKNKKGNEDARKEAIEAFKKGDDTFDFKLELNGTTLKSSLTFHEGMLRYFGKVGAKFVKDNLQN